MFHCPRWNCDLEDVAEWQQENCEESGMDCYDCPYNDGVACTKKQCEGCGWNPEVARKRDEKLRNKLGMATNG